MLGPLFRTLLLVSLALTLMGLWGCSLIRPLPKPADLESRLAAIPVQGSPVKGEVVIHWDEHLIPFIEAEHDLDLAFALGLVQAHLRLGQMEFVRLASQGRLAEAMGPFVTDIDHSIRLLGFDWAVEAMEENLPPSTRAWLSRYVEGVNFYLTRAGKLPHEFTALGLTKEPWTIRDILILSRLFGTDVNWLGYFSLLRARGAPDWEVIWGYYLEGGRKSLPSFGPDPEDRLGLLLSGPRSGSNSIVVGLGKSATGSALMANDPHLGVMVPNVWMICGLKSPSYHLLGLMIPGLPAMALGRNPHLAWGGTNMRAASSDLYNVSGLPPDRFRERKVRLKVRWWPDKEITIRETDLGPVVTDSPLLKEYQGPPLSLKWVGHQPSDEIGAILAANRARSWEEFKAAWQGYGISGQNVLYADPEGKIGQLLAVHLPHRKAGGPSDLSLDPGDPDRLWKGLLSSEELPSVLDPPAGFLVSANNRPVIHNPPLGYSFTSNDRIRRLRQLLGGPRKIGLEDLKRLQLDVTTPAGLDLKKVVLGLVGEEERSGELGPVLELITAFDGRLAADSRSALAFQLLVNHLARSFYGRKLSETSAKVVIQSAELVERLALDLAAEEAGPARSDLRAALAAAALGLEKYSNWGQIHRLEVAHPLARIPLIGGRYRFGEYPVSGGSTTLMKTAHGQTDEPHQVRYGSQARHISDLADPDANWFLLLGGQDGWLPSPFLTDQIPLWLEGEYIHLPLTMAKVRERFSRKTRLAPLAGK